MNEGKARVYVTVSGGVAEVLAPRNVEVVVIDCDIHEQDYINDGCADDLLRWVFRFDTGERVSEYDQVAAVRIEQGDNAPEQFLDQEFLDALEEWENRR